MPALVTPPAEHQIRPDCNKTQAGRSPEDLKGGLVPVRPVHHQEEQQGGAKKSGDLADRLTADHSTQEVTRIGGHSGASHQEATVDTDLLAGDIVAIG